MRITNIKDLFKYFKRFLQKHIVAIASGDVIDALKKDDKEVEADIYGNRNIPISEFVCSKYKEKKYFLYWQRKISILIKLSILVVNTVDYSNYD